MAQSPKRIKTLSHDAASRKNIPTAEFESVMAPAEQAPVRVAYERRNRDLDPQLVWRGKDERDASDLMVHAPPLFIQEKVHPKVLIDDLQRRTRQRRAEAVGPTAQHDLFAEFNGLPNDDTRTEFYQHDANWSNRMILGDSLQVMASLAEREGLRGKVQCIYLDPPYGIKFNSNFQWSTTSRDVKDGKAAHITREPEQVRAFRDTWRDGIHSYLTYLKDRLTVARDLLAESGSIFVQIGDENLHRVRALMDEVFGENNFILSIVIKKKSVSIITEPVNDYVLWASKGAKVSKIRNLTEPKDPTSEKNRFKKIEKPDLTRISLKDAKPEDARDPENRMLNDDYPMVSQDLQKGRVGPYSIHNQEKFPGSNRHWTLDPDDGMKRLERANRLRPTTNTIRGVVYLNDFGQEPINNIWNFHGEPDPVYVVQTNRGIVQRCILMTTDPGDLVLDPTCGSGTTAYVAEQWGRRWITIDTSRVALALARARIMGARYPYYLLADSPEGQRKEAEITRATPSETPTHGDVRQGFVYERVPHVTLKSIANNTEIDVIWERWQETLEPLRENLNAALGQSWEEWEIPRDAGEPWPAAAAAAWKRLRAAETDAERMAALARINDALGRAYTLKDCPIRPRDPWPADVTDVHHRWWDARIARQQEIDASIAARADVEYLYDKPYEGRRTVRVAGRFTVESVSPHRLLAVDEHDELINDHVAKHAKYASADATAKDFAAMVLGHLGTTGVQQAHKSDRITFSSLEPWPGDFICAEGRYIEGDTDGGPERRAGILVGPEFGTVARQDLVRAAREAGDAGFDVLITCAFNYEPHSTEFNKLGALPVLKARMNADLHMADDLKNTGKGNLFVIFGEPDIEILPADGEDHTAGRVLVKINGVDVFHPNTGEVRSDDADGIACWFIDTDYNDESFFVRHAYFLGANDPYQALRTTLKSEIDPEAWATLHSDTSRPFERPASGRIAVKVINHLGDEVMKVFRV